MRFPVIMICNCELCNFAGTVSSEMGDSVFIKKYNKLLPYLKRSSR